MTELLVIVPTRSRPEAVARVVEAWEATGAFDDGAELMFAFDADDPECSEYVNAINHTGVRREVLPVWFPLVVKLNRVAREVASSARRPFAIGFAGDDHLPRTTGWVARYLGALYSAGTGVVSCPDGYRPDDLPTQWAMTADIVRTLGRMVPAPVDHLYCDNAVQDLARAADCMTYLADVLIEHMHPVAGKAATDEQYERVNSRQQFRHDRAAYRLWRDTELAQQAGRVRDLIEKGE